MRRRRLLDRGAKLAPNGPRVALGRATLHRRAKAYDLALTELNGLEERFGGSGFAVAALSERRGMYWTRWGATTRLSRRFVPINKKPANKADTAI